MSTTTETQLVDVGCDQCSQTYRVPANRTRQVLGSHMARVHDVAGKSPRALTTREMRKGAPPSYLRARTREAMDAVANRIESGSYRHGEKLVISSLQDQTGFGSGALISGLNVLATRGLVQRQGAYFYVTHGPAEEGAPGAARPPGDAVDLQTNIVAEWLREEIATKYPVGAKLPSQAKLAASYGTSKTTVVRAIEMLKDQGLRLSTNKAAGSVVTALPSPEESAVETTVAEREPGPPPPPPAPELPPTKRSKLVDYLRDLILNGSYGPDELLPSSRVLASKTNVSQHTVSEAYRQLEAEGLIRIRSVGATVVPEDQRPPAHGTTTSGKRLTDAVIEELADEAERGYEVGEDEDDEGESFGLDLLRGMLIETRRSWAAVDKLKARVKELEARPDLEPKLREATEALDKMRGVLHRQEEENAELRGKLHRQKRNGFTSFGPDFKNNVGEALGFKPGEMKRFMETARER